MDKIDEVLTSSVDEIIVRESLINKLRSSEKLIVKLGIDPTGTDLHLGHAVVLRKLRQFQDLGHQAVLVIGDFTASIGDPSGRNVSRKVLTKEEIEKNMTSYKEQAGKILDLKKVKFEYNSTWLAKMDLYKIFELASKATLAQIFERKDFRQRVEEGDDVSYLETLYPLMQGYDSVRLRADVELGGTDQKFNLLMGRQMQKRYGQKEQDVVIMKLLLGTDGSKMSKSAGNYIPINTNAFDIYGKVMSISDDLIPEYYELCTNVIIENKPNDRNPYLLKRNLAKEITSNYFGKSSANQAELKFDQVHKEHKYNEAQIEIFIKPGQYQARMLPILSNATGSTVHAKKLVLEGAVELNDQKVLIPNSIINLAKGDIIRIGKKRFIKVK